MQTSATPDRTLTTLRRRLERWELEHLRKHAAELAERLEQAEEKARYERECAEDWWNTAMNLQQELMAEGHQIGLTVDGQIGVCRVAESDKSVSHVKLELSPQPFREDQPVALPGRDVESLLEILKGRDALAGDVHGDGVSIPQGVEQRANLGKDMLGNSGGLSSPADDIAHEAGPRGPASDLVGREGDDVVHGECSPVSSEKSNRKSFCTDLDSISATVDGQIGLLHQAPVEPHYAAATDMLDLLTRMLAETEDHPSHPAVLWIDPIRAVIAKATGKAGA